jgi:hypothetical protein
LDRQVYENRQTTPKMQYPNPERPDSHGKCWNEAQIGVPVAVVQPAWKGSRFYHEMVWLCKPCRVEELLLGAQRDGKSKQRVLRGTP